MLRAYDALELADRVSLVVLRVLLTQHAHVRQLMQLLLVVHVEDHGGCLAVSSI